mmetsp:Transcript_38629/g.43892  ORF Transcript_38629/g.43892 Transcript_38629/m.43892 type:complete len:361 (+) Transcript_38629:32-1114(+)
MSQSRSYLHILLSVILLSLSSCRSSINPAKVTYAVNCGGSEYVDKDGVRYVKDTGYDSGIESDFGQTIQFMLTEDETVYKNERYGLDTFSYTIPVTEDGKYVLILKFSEVYFQKSGEKVFDVRIGDVSPIQNMDIFDKVGRYAAYDKFVQLEIKDGSLFIDDKEVEDAYSSDDDELTIDFVKREHDNPKVNGIILVKGTLDDTHYQSHEYLMKEIETLKKKQLEEQKAAAEKKKQTKKSQKETGKKQQEKKQDQQADDFEETNESIQEDDTEHEDKTKKPEEQRKATNWDYAKNIQSDDFEESYSEFDTVTLGYEGEGGLFELMFSLPGFLISLLLAVFSGSFYLIDKAERQTKKSQRVH